MRTITFEAPHSVISDLTLIVDGRPKRVSFTPITAFEGSHTGNGSWLVTSDPALQNAIMGCPLFGSSISILADKSTSEAREVKEDGGEEEELAVDEVDLQHISADEVSSLTDAREYLEEHFGVDKKKVSNPKALQRVAAECGVVFDAL